MIGGKHRPLAWRLALLLGIAVIAVLLLVGIVVNQVVRSQYESVLSGQQQERLDDAAAGLAERGQNVDPKRAQAVVRRLAASLGGEVWVIAPDGTTLATGGSSAEGDVTYYNSDIVVDGVTVATLEADLPVRNPDGGFLRLFNVTLIVAGLVSVIGIAFASASLAGRLTRPLRDVASAARRLEAGDPTARATGGDDLESAELADAFNAMASRLERSEMLRRRAASDIAHDLATPATVLELQLQAMVDGVVPIDRANLEAARSTAAALGRVVADIDDLARAEAAPLHARPTEVDLGELVEEACLALDGAGRERSIELVRVVPPGLLALADPGHLGRALRNVIANAIAHSPPDAVVEVEVGDDDRLLAVRVTDRGPGIAEDDLPHVFERFYRSDLARAPDPETGRATGLGLGLTIARELLAASGGSIRVEQTTPTGTTFLVEVPRAQRKSTPR